MRTKIEVLFPHSYSLLARFIAHHRETLKHSSIQNHNEGQRRAFWDKILNGPIALLVLDRREDEATRLMERLIDEETNNGAIESITDKPPTYMDCQSLTYSSKESCDSKGYVWIVGAGPGDPDMLTIG